MKRLIGSVVFACLFSSVAIASQEPAADKPRPGEKPASPDAPFIGTAAMDGLAEIELGRLATRNASSPDVKQFAQRMVDDHSKASDELKAFAAKKEITLATKLDDQHRAAQKSLAKLTGAAFDKAYMDHTVKAHLEAVSLFQQEAKTGRDSELKAWAAKTLPTLQDHLKLATSIATKVSKRGT
jgi:putative membrane protein